MAGIDSSDMFQRGDPKAFESQGASTQHRIGASRHRNVPKRLFRDIDQVGATASSYTVRYGFTVNREMSIEQAGLLTDSIMKTCGIKNESDAVQLTFLRAMFLCMAANSASVQMPDRATFSVNDSSFNFWSDVMAILGNDARRYFRAYADVIRGFIKDLHEEYKAGPNVLCTNPEDVYEDVCIMWGYIKFAAEDRGLGRVPDLVHDSADSCSGLTSSEQAFLKGAKATIFADMVNRVDKPLVVRSGETARPGAVSRVDAQPMGDDY